MLRPLACLLLILCLTGSLPAAIERQGDAFVIAGPRGQVRISATDGSILAVIPAGQKTSIWASGENGLWSARFIDGTMLHAVSFVPAASRQGHVAHEGDSLRFSYDSPALVATVTLAARPDGVEMTADVRPREAVLLDFALPGRLRFEPAKIDRLIYPANGNFAVGLSLKPAFFQLQPQDHPASWRPETVGSKIHQRITGGGLAMRPLHDPAVPLRITDAGRQWFDAAAVRRIEAARGIVNRGPGKGVVADEVLVESEHGPFFYRSRLGGTGGLWRIAGNVGDRGNALSLSLIGGTITKLSQSAEAPRRRIAVLSLRNGPDSGAFTPVGVSEWVEQLRARKLDVAELATPAEMRAAMAAGDHLAIVNPYGEGVPPIGDTAEATADAIAAYIKAGGNWFEVGGYPFHAILRPVRYLTYSATYPPAFADFAQLDTPAGSSALYAARPARKGAWEAAADHAAIFIPGQLGCGGDERGGFIDRTFSAHIAPGQSWRTPPVRLVIGGDGMANLREYAAANDIRVKLDQKMRPDVLEKFKRSVLIKYEGPAAELTANLPKLPSPSLLHFSNYLKGGFDKEYPDHVPPRPSFGTPQQFRQFIDAARAAGHLLMPYTNPTWWCDEPRGPTFLREGDAPLLRGLDGKPKQERYSDNTGWTITFWHPAVRAANRRTIRDFTEDYPMDLLLQDQCGARTWHYDTNPASPTPYAYVEGLLSMVQEDAKTRPLSTESGWDGIINYEAQFCGMSWGIVPTANRPRWSRLMKYQYPPATWDIYPVAQILAHDKLAMVHHDLGQFVTSRQTLTWTLAIGYGMSYRTAASRMNDDATRQWLLWLDRIQKSICSRCTGEPLVAWHHDRKLADEDELIDVTYGQTRIITNVGSNPQEVEGRAVPGFGFRATAPGLVAADLGPEAAYVSEGNARRAEVWIYSAGGRPVEVELPAAMDGPVTVTFDGEPAQRATITGRNLALQPPPSPAGSRLWHAIIERRPRP